MLCVGPGVWLAGKEKVLHTWMPLFPYLFEPLLCVRMLVTSGPKLFANALIVANIGSVIKVSDKWNARYYQTPGVRPTDIFVTKAVDNPGSKTLREIVKQAENTM